MMMKILSGFLGALRDLRVSLLRPSSVVNKSFKRIWITEIAAALCYTEKSKGLQVLAF